MSLIADWMAGLEPYFHFSLSSSLALFVNELTNLMQLFMGYWGQSVSKNKN